MRKCRARPDRVRIASGPHRSLADLPDGVAQEARGPARADDGAVGGLAGEREGPRPFRRQQERRLGLGHSGKPQPAAVVRHVLAPEQTLHEFQALPERIEARRLPAKELHGAVAQPEAELDPAPGKDGEGGEAVGHHRGVAGLQVRDRQPHHRARRGHGTVRHGHVRLGAARRIVQPDVVEPRVLRLPRMRRQHGRMARAQAQAEIQTSVSHDPFPIPLRPRARALARPGGFLPPVPAWCLANDANQPDTTPGLRSVVRRQRTRVGEGHHPAGEGLQELGALGAGFVP